MTNTVKNVKVKHFFSDSILYLSNEFKLLNNLTYDYDENWEEGYLPLKILHNSNN